MQKSLKQIITTFNTYADNHKIIKYFEAKPPTEFTSKDYLYPLQWVELVDDDVNDGIVIINMNIYFLDLLKSDNFIKIQSDMLRLCTDFYSYFRDNAQDFGFLLGKGPMKVSPIVYQFDDDVCGKKMPVNIRVAFSRDEQKIPI